MDPDIITFFMLSVPKCNVLSIKDITIIADSCDMMLKEAEYR